MKLIMFLQTEGRENECYSPGFVTFAMIVTVLVTVLSLLCCDINTKATYKRKHLIGGLLTVSGVSPSVIAGSVAAGTAMALGQ